MVRVFAVGMLLLLIVQIILGLVFWAGYAWLGGVTPGLLLALGVLILLILPWIGELMVQFDSRNNQLTVHAAWWGQAQVTMGKAKELRLRIFGIPIRRKLGEKPGTPAGAEPRIETGRWARENAKNLTRLALAAVQAGNEMYWEARKITVTVNAPSQVDIVDQIVAGIIGHRMLSQFDIKVLPEGPRRIHARYRIGLLRIAAALLYVLVQGRALALRKSQQRAKRQAKVTQETRPPREQSPRPRVAPG